MKYGKQFGFAAKAAAVVAVVAGVATAGFDIKESKATLTAPTGKCGYLLTLKSSGFDTKYTNSASTQTVAQIGVIDFDTGTSNNIQTKVSNWGASGSSAANTTVASQSTFSLVAGNYAGKYVMTINNGYNSKFNIISTNTANTYLVQGLPDSNNSGAVLTGMCQAL